MSRNRLRIDVLLLIVLLAAGCSGGEQADPAQSNDMPAETAAPTLPAAAETSLPLPSSLPPGSYSWTVLTLDANGVPVAELTSNFIVTGS